MFKARKKGFSAESIDGPKLKGQHHGMVYAKHVDPDKLDEDLLCPCCDVPVVYRKASKSVNGGLERSSPTFVTKPGYKDEHKRGCSYVSPDIEFNKQANNVKSLRQAIADDHYIRLNLNFITEGVSYSTYPSLHKRQPEELEKWKKKHKDDYLNVSVNSLDSYIKAIRDIRSYADEFWEGDEQRKEQLFDKIYVHYMGRVQSRREFSGGETSSLRQEFKISAALDHPVAVRQNRRGQSFTLGRLTVVEVKPEDYIWRKNDAQNIVAEPRDKSGPWQGFIFKSRFDDDFKKRIEQAKASEAFLVAAAPVTKLADPYVYGQSSRDAVYTGWMVTSAESISDEPAHNL